MALFNPNAPQYFRDDFTKLSEYLKPYAVPTGDGNYVLVGAPEVPASAFQHLLQHGYANGWLS